MDVQALTAAVAAACPIDGVSIGDPADRSTWRIDAQAGATPDQRAAAQRVVANWTGPTPARAATLSTLFDVLSPAQRASFTADHKDRIEAEASEHPGGLLPIANSKVVRAAGDLGMTPDAWFKLAGC